MHFYRTLQPIFALSFDFDNTLYNNRPIIAYAEQKALLFLQKYHPMLHNIRKIDCDAVRFCLYRKEPDICHDVTYWRWKALEIMLCNAGLSKYEARFGADCAMDIIIRWRNEVDISKTVRDILVELGSRWPLVAITNGNLNPAICGLESYFSYIFYAGKDGRAKPYRDMYYLAAKRLGLSCKNILHIGDTLDIDIKGAIFSGMQGCWINEHIDAVYHRIKKEFCPHIEISSLLSLTNLL